MIKYAFFRPLKTGIWITGWAALLLLLTGFADGQAMAAADTNESPSGGGATRMLLAHDRSRGGGPYGPTMAVDLCFPYYRTNSYASVCRSIREQGFTCVHLVDYGSDCPGELQLRRFATAARAAGLSPVLCVYPGTHSGLYRAHPEWRQRMLTGVDGKCDWRTYLCPNKPAFVAAYCNYIEGRMREGLFDGIQLAEIWYENWGGPQAEGRPNPRYACVCDDCAARFKKLTGADAVSMLTDPASATYYGRPQNAALYEKWVGMRVQIIQDYGAAIIATVRRAQPGACVKIMYMSDARVELNGGREYQGADLDRMVKEWHPDVLCFQDAWQDWLQQNLRPEFIRDYAQAYKQRVEKLQPGIFLTSHADIGSKPESRRDAKWIRSFAKETVRAGFGAPTFYEWHISTLAAAQPAPAKPSDVSK